MARIDLNEIARHADARTAGRASTATVIHQTATTTKQKGKTEKKKKIK
jgi:hypothetical protein